MSKIVIFGARGNIGSHLVKTLYRNSDVQLRLISSSKDGVAGLSESYPEAEVLQASLSEAESIKAAIKNVDRIYVMYPDFEFDEEASTKAMILAVANEPSVKHVVRLLGVTPAVSKDDIPISFRGQPSMPCWVHWRGRELWQDSGLPVTFINPWSWYMQSFPWLVGEGITSNDIFCLPHSHTLPYIDTRDIAEVAAKVLLADVDKFVGLELGLTGHKDDCFSFLDIADLMTKELGRKIQYSASVAKFEEFLGEAAGPLDSYIGWEKSVVGDYYMHTDVVEQILGKSPRRFIDWLRESRAQFESKDEL